jgi:hypothetical protein
MIERQCLVRVFKDYQQMAIRKEESHFYCCFEYLPRMGDRIAENPAVPNSRSGKVADIIHYPQPVDGDAVAFENAVGIVAEIFVTRLV